MSMQAKDAGSHGPHNWPHDCTGPEALACPFAADYASFLKLLSKLGRNGKPNPSPGSNPWAWP